MTETKHLIPSIAEAELLAKAESWFKTCQSRRTTIERVWYTNLAFYFGRQWVEWVGTDSLQRLTTPSAPSWRVRLTVNKVRSFIRKELSKLTQEEPRGFVIPASSDDDDIAAASAGDAIMESLYRDLQLKKVFRQAIFWCSLVGTGFVKAWAEPPTPVEADAASGIMGNVGPGLAPVGALELPTPDPELKVERINPFHIFVPDLDEEDLDKQPYVIHAVPKNVAWVKAKYGIELAPDSIAENTFFSSAMTSIGIMAREKDCVLVKELWLKPNSDHPEGLYLIWAGDQLLEEPIEGWPYSHGEYPFTKIINIMTGTFYGTSIINDLIPLQKELNRSRSQIIENKNRMAKLQLVAQKGAIDANRITTEPGLIIEYNLGFNPPTPLPLQPLPGYLFNELDRLVADMSDVASQHEISKGQTPPGVRAATAIAFLQENDDSSLALTIASIEEAHEVLGRQLLGLVHQFWSAEHTVKVAGYNNTFETYVFSQASIRGNTSYKIEAGSAIPRSRAAKQAFILELMEKGAIPVTVGLRYLDMSSTAKIYEELNRDVRQAQRENLKMQHGVELGANSWDSHEAHIATHNDYRKSQHFEVLDDSIKVLFQGHIAQHNQLLAQSQGYMLTPGAVVPANGQKPPMPQQKPQQQQQNGAQSVSKQPA